ncbi:Arc family DNA-binding protein [Sphingomonas daechungensis]|uniref:Arc family DNA-binding protein n=1 Tax=Sphingomonas daechungensis TaxID=1176646 RepID=A0ABX6T2U6_9SPHN|nr:Arc family DNA-binding protein [Sphingomonas daechungensis]
MGYLKAKEPKRHVVTMRMSETMRERINGAATANGRSVSQEIESRLERSLQDEMLLGGSETTILAKLVIGAVALIETESGKPWNEDRMTWEAVNSAVRTILTSFQPQIDLDIWERHRELLLTFWIASPNSKTCAAKLKALRRLIRARRTFRRKFVRSTKRPGRNIRSAWSA